MSKKCDVLIIGAGVVGLSTGIALLQSRPSLKVTIADKEKDIALHASGRNSGVIHFLLDAISDDSDHSWDRPAKSLNNLGTIPTKSPA